MHVARSLGHKFAHNAHKVTRRVAKATAGRVGCAFEPSSRNGASVTEQPARHASACIINALTTATASNNAKKTRSPPNGDANVEPTKRACKPPAEGDTDSQRDGLLALFAL